MENNLTMFVTGTDPEQKKSSSKDLDPKLRNAVEQTFNEELTDFEWTGGNTQEARTQAAHNLNEIISNHEFAPGEQLNLVGFSHGGNDLKEFTQIYSGNKKIDNLIFLGTPHRLDYQLDFSDLSGDANLVSIYGNRDGIQTRGYVDGNIVNGALAQENYTLQIMNGFKNIKVQQPFYYYPLIGHINLKSEKVWHNFVVPNLNK